MCLTQAAVVGQRSKLGIDIRFVRALIQTARIRALQVVSLGSKGPFPQASAGNDGVFECDPSGIVNVDCCVARRNSGVIGEGHIHQ